MKYSVTSIYSLLKLEGHQGGREGKEVSPMYYLHINGGKVGPFASRAAALAHYRKVFQSQQVWSCKLFLDDKFQYTII